MTTTILNQNFSHAQVPALAMPLGGIGTGGCAINADGSLRQWQLAGTPNHRGVLPGTGFWLRTTQIEPPLNIVQMVQGTPVSDPKAPLVTDGDIPHWMLEAAESFGSFREVRYSGTYPIAEISMSDPAHPLRVRMRAFNPLAPGDVSFSSIPVGMFEFTLTNSGEYPLHGILAGSLLNSVGWDGITPITADGTPGLGGNVNRRLRGKGWSRVVMDNVGLDESEQYAGQMVLGADDSTAAVLARCSGLAHLRAFLDSRALNDGRSRLALAPTLGDPQRGAPASGQGPSPEGKSWLGVVGVPYELEPGDSRTIRFSIAWHFPNRMVDVEQFGQPHPEWGSSTFYVGNAYSQRFRDACEVQTLVEEEWFTLRDRTEKWTRTLCESDLTDGEVDRLAAQAAYIRSPTCFMGADGRFYGYEGSLGESTWMWSGVYGGSCPLNCTHVWQYEAALACLWPSLERNMRDTEFDVMQAHNGAIPHRLRIPVYLQQMGDEKIGGPEEPALDGMLATILKSLRDVQHGAGDLWVNERWGNLTRLYRYIVRTWDRDGDGVLHGIQPSTHDIDLAGINPYIGSLWLASLRAYEELAMLVGDNIEAHDARARFESGSVRYDEIMFDGTHYIQVLEEGDPLEFQWVTGVLSDQVIGQWWAHQLGLGYVLPREHVRSALRAVVDSNLRQGFNDFSHPYRVYADTATDVGLLMCSWPHDGRPDVPTRYADEVWTGVEWQVAAHLAFEGLEDYSHAVLEGLWNRHDGSRRNPYNEIECGDHYARAMSGWTLLQARSGVRIDESTATLHVSRDGRWPWFSSLGYGTVEVRGGDVVVSTSEGSFDFQVVRDS